MRASLQFLGGVGTVTGSRFLIELNGSRVLVDCGLFQGLKPLRLRNWEPFPVPPDSIDVVVVTHSHLDHIGYLPALYEAGFRGPVLGTAPTVDLAEILLLDAAHLYEEDAEYANRKGHSKHHPALPLYTQGDAAAVAKNFVPVPMGEAIELVPGLEARLQPAGHILGACTVELTFEGSEAGRTLFSGDLGRPDPPLVEAPTPADRELDSLVIESTYGDRELPSREEALTTLAGTICKTVARGGWVVIPAFAVDRTPSVLHGIRELVESGRIPELPVFADSPMALRALAVYRKHSQYFDSPVRDLLEQGINPFDTGHLVLAGSREESMAISDSQIPGIIVSASGMATGGRILHHLKRRLPDPRNTVVLTGFQADGTRGRSLSEGARYVKIHGRYVPVNAQIEQIDGFSSHADRSELLRWMDSFETPPRITYVVHGEPAASEQLCRDIEQQLGWSAVVPRLLERVVLR